MSARSSSLSADAQGLAAGLRASDDGTAILVIPTAERAIADGCPAADWLTHRESLLTSIGTAIKELRAAGWRLSVHSLTGPTNPHPDAERVVVVTQETE